VEEMEMPAGRVAVFTHKGPYEVYVNEKGIVPTEELITEIYIQIK
jgi:effector-binding domain-containing protein